MVVVLVKLGMIRGRCFEKVVVMVDAGGSSKGV